MSKTSILRKKLESQSILKVGGAFDAMSAKLVEISGFDAIWAVRAAHASMTRMLKQMINSNSLNEIKEEISSMEDIFNLQEMYNIKKKEKDLEDELRKLGYIT